MISVIEPTSIYPPKKETVKWSLFLDFTLLFLVGGLLTMACYDFDVVAGSEGVLHPLPIPGARRWRQRHSQKLADHQILEPVASHNAIPVAKATRNKDTHSKNSNFFGTMKNDRNLNSPFQWIGWNHVNKHNHISTMLLLFQWNIAGSNMRF